MSQDATELIEQRIRNMTAWPFFVMVVAAAEAAVGLAIILTVFKNRQTLNIDDINSMKN